MEPPLGTCTELACLPSRSIAIYALAAIRPRKLATVEFFTLPPWFVGEVGVEPTRISLCNWSYTEATVYPHYGRRFWLLSTELHSALLVQSQTCG